MATIWDIDELLKLEILIKEGDFYFANISTLNKMIAKKRLIGSQELVD